MSALGGMRTPVFGRFISLNRRARRFGRAPLKVSLSRFCGLFGVSVLLGDKPAYSPRLRWQPTLMRVGHLLQVLTGNERAGRGMLPSPRSAQQHVAQA